MDKVTTPDNSTSSIPRVMDDIPIAQRETPVVAPKSKFKKSHLFGGMAAVATIALVAGALVASQFQRSQVSSASMASVAVKPVESSPPSPTSSPSGKNPSDDTVLGHFRYPEAPQPSLAPIVADGSIKLRKTAARAYQEMESAARRDGVVLVAISGFRSLNDQNYLFFGKKAERGQAASERAKVSAPPGYSEHHTGYAIDIGDGNVPATHLSPAFENTAAFKWLKTNAAFYSFELSFPEGNSQGVMYEPWHWRYVGDSHSLETFFKARPRK